jgi:hypothetical protein
MAVMRNLECTLDHRGDMLTPTLEKSSPLWAGKARSLLWDGRRIPDQTLHLGVGLGPFALVARLPSPSDRWVVKRVLARLPPVGSLNVARRVECQRRAQRILLAPTVPCRRYRRAGLEC